MHQKPLLPAGIAPYRNAILAGPKAAGLLGWDGFDPKDPAVWLQPRSARSKGGAIRTKYWRQSDREIDGYPIACDEMVLSYLLVGLRSRPRWENDAWPITPVESLELAVEFLLRSGYTFAEFGQVVPSAFLPTQPKFPAACTARVQLERLNVSGAATRSVLLARGPHEPPTESYLETRTIQQLRRGGFPRVFRQVPLFVEKRIVNRIDIVVAAPRQVRRPEAFSPRVGAPVEADGREFHTGTFEKDRRRANNHSVARTQLLVVTSNMVEREPKTIISAINRIFLERARQGPNRDVAH